MRFSWLVFVLGLLLAPSGTVAKMVISEVMANPMGPESGSGSPGDRNEYVELYNADSTTVDVEAWVLWDGDALDLIRAWSDTNLADPDVVINTTNIQPGCFAVILDPEYTDLGDSTWPQPYDFPPGTVILTVQNTTIGNGLSSLDPLSLGTPDTVFVDTYGTPDDTLDSIPFNGGDGVSIERIDLLLPDREDNWAPCKDSMGTPGGKNSVTAVLEEMEGRRERLGLRLRVRPNPFRKRTTIVVSVVSEESEQVRLDRSVGYHKEYASIYDIAGRRVRDFREFVTGRGSGDGRTSYTFEIVWDGLEDGGVPVPPGVYFCLVGIGREHGTVEMTRVR